MNIYIEEVGEDGDELCFHLYTTNKKCAEDEGIQYDSLEKQHIFSFVEPTPDKILPDDLKRLFMYSFKHGSNDIEIPRRFLRKDYTYKKLFDVLRDRHKYKYDWINKKDIKLQKYISNLQLKTKQDVINNRNILLKGRVPYSVITTILGIFNIPLAKACNGEIGIAAFIDITNYRSLLESLNKQTKKKKNEL